MLLQCILELLEKVTGLCLRNVCTKVAMKLIWKLIDILPSQVLKLLNSFAEPGNIITYYTKSTRNVSRYTTRPPH